MPGKSGLEFINENKNFLETPIILLTAKGEPDERIEGLEIGADDYLPKPFEPKELLLRIKNIINKTKKIDQKRVVEFENIKIEKPAIIVIEVFLIAVLTVFWQFLTASACDPDIAIYSRYL